MKRISVIILVVTMLFICVACTNHPDNGSTASESTTQTRGIETQTTQSTGTTSVLVATTTATAVKTTTTAITFATRTTTTGMSNISEFPTEETHPSMGRHRSIYYNISGHFADIVGREKYFKWAEEYDIQSDDWHDMEMMLFVQHFNITREQFDKANEKRKQQMIEDGRFGDGNIGEIYNADIIYTFDAKLISDYYSIDRPPYYG